MVHFENHFCDCATNTAPEYRGFQVACQNYTHAIRKVHYCKLTTNYIVTLGRFLRTGNCYTSLLAKGPKHRCHLLKICAECTIWKMPCTYSTDLRWRIVWLYYYQEKSFDEIEKLLFVSSRSSRRYVALFLRNWRCISSESTARTP